MANPAASSTPLEIPSFAAAKSTGSDSEPKMANADQAPLVRLPTFEYGDAWVAGARRAGRLNAAHISEQERIALLAERQSLLDRKFEGSISPQESRRLEYVRWSLDRIEDARYGEHLDRLDAAVTRYEELKEDIAALIANLNAVRRR